METKLIEPKPVTYHVTKYVYPNVDNNGDLNGLNGGYLNNGGLNNNSFHQAGFTNQYHNSGGDLAAIFPDAKKTSYNPIYGTTSHHNGYGLHSTSVPHIVRPRTSGAHGTAGAGCVAGDLLCSLGEVGQFLAFFGFDLGVETANVGATISGAKRSAAGRPVRTSPSR